MKNILILAGMLVAGCERDRPPAPTAEQSSQLDEAEAMLNEQDEAENAARPAE